jgi:hypothetical protein
MAFPLLPVSSNTRINASVTRSVLQNKIKSITNDITKKKNHHTFKTKLKQNFRKTNSINLTHMHNTHFPDLTV